MIACIVEVVDIVVSHQYSSFVDLTLEQWALLLWNLSISIDDDDDDDD